MSFYIRKSLRAGPFRFNFSKSGVGVSTGFTGFRIGTGPRGNYVHMGRNGLYYKATLPSGQKHSKSPSTEEPIETPSSVEMKEIESVDILQLQDSSSAELLVELNNKHKELRFWPIVVVISLIGLAVLYFLNVQVWVYAIVIPIAVIATFLAYRRDQLAKSVVLFYELESDAENAFQSLHDGFNEIANCAQTWHVSHSGKISDLNEWKRSAGASTLVNRKTTHISPKAPPFVSTNLSIPAIPVGKQVLYFFPDRILVYEGNKVGAVSYSDIELQLHNTRFIESQSVPNDAQIVDRTWQYVNKKGGPDKRFKNNRQLPIALYGEILFKSSSGLNELIQTSKPNIGETFLESMKKLAILIP